MRLLNSTTLEPTEFFDSQIPEYVILSHTWGEVGVEVSFQDLINKDFTKEGFTKINMCCNLAVQEGVQWAWIDTCCIDKKSSAELTEAINSMFRWYENAKVCYAYLADVPTISGYESFKSAFTHSRWFTRGWTLQELLAPKEVRFFSKEWRFIGTRATLCNEIYHTTAIEPGFIKGENVRFASIAKRMSWASKRKTTRSEDTAYCLLGIFGVNMPLIYGEGDKAFKRLQEQIMKSSNDQSLFAWGHGLHRLDDEPQGLLADSPAKFTEAGNVISYRGWMGGAPFTTTNGGVRIRFPIASSSSLNGHPELTSSTTVYIAALGCHVEENFWDVLAIPIQELVNGNFARTDASKPFLIPRDMWMRSDCTIRSIFIVESFPSIYPLSRDIALSLFPMSRRSYTISEVFPPHLWDETQRIILRGNQNSSKCDIAFLFVGETKGFILYLRSPAYGPLSWGIYPIPPQGSTLETFFYNIRFIAHIGELELEKRLSCTFEGETFDLSFFDESRWGKWMKTVQVESWNEEQMENVEIQKMRASGEYIRKTGDYASLNSSDSEDY